MGTSATGYRVFSHDTNPPYCVRMSLWWNVLFIRKKKEVTKLKFSCTTNLRASCECPKRSPSGYATQLMTTKRWTKLRQWKRLISSDVGIHGMWQLDRAVWIGKRFGACDSGFGDHNIIVRRVVSSSQTMQLCMSADSGFSEETCYPAAMLCIWGPKHTVAIFSVSELLKLTLMTSFVGYLISCQAIIQCSKN